MEKKTPREVFARRLRELRKRRGLTQAQLAEGMTAAGRPLSKAAVLRIEAGTRDISLDEAIAFASVLSAAPAHLLAPAEGEAVALTDRMAVDRGALRDFLLLGNPLFAFAQSAFEEGTLFEGDRDEILGEQMRQTMTPLALALADAYLGKDPDGVRAAARAIVETVHNFEKRERQLQKEGDRG
jgi:transcriptional regulator with XRE-family HTH domain